MIDIERAVDVTPPAPDAVPAIEAVVHAGAVETHYRRAGCGPAVLLLFPGGPADPPAARLFDRLARRFRVIAPRPPASLSAPESTDADPPPLAGWLRDLIDGLGLARPALVVHPSLAADALAFSRTDPDRAGTLISLSHDDGERWAENGMVGITEAISRSLAPAEPSLPC